jgi:DNA-binding winged helix-turn-helix (wHTH) protein/TolB-like protein
MPSSSRLFFDEFELRLDSGELLRDGTPAATLQPQPARVLGLLAGRSGEVVSREEIRRTAWGEAFVDFDASLNFCIKQLRRTLGDSATSPRFIETLPRRGYRFLPPVRTSSDAGSTPDELLPPLPRQRARMPRAVAWVAVTASLTALLVVLIASRLHPAKPRLAVLPLACAGASPVDRQVCGGVTAALTEELARRISPEVEVIAPLSALAYQGSRKSARTIGGELGAAYLLTGEVDASGGRLRITGRLATAAGKPLWHQSLETELAAASLAYDQVVQGVAGALEVAPPAVVKPAAKPRAEAYAAYLRGMFLERQRRFDEAAASLQEAVLLDDRFARAYAELARARVAATPTPREDAPVSLAAARKALELDPRLPEGHLALGEVLFKERLDWQRAGEEYRRAVELAPGDAQTHFGYAGYLAAVGRLDEAISAIERARELDPASMVVDGDYAWFLYIARRYDEAVRQARDTLSLLKMTATPLPEVARYGDAWSYWVLVHGSWKRGDELTAIHTVKEKMREIGQGGATASLTSLQDVWNWRVKWNTAQSQGKPGVLYGLAAVNASAGRTDEALRLLEQECANGEGVVVFNFVAVEPVFDVLHGNPRFERIVDCTGLPKNAPAHRLLQASAATRWKTAPAS